MATTLNVPSETVWLCFEFKVGAPIQDALDFQGAFYDHGYIPGVDNTNFDSKAAKLAVRLVAGTDPVDFIGSLPADLLASRVLERWFSSAEPCV